MITVDLDEGEVLDSINSLDTYSRLWMGQFDHLAQSLRMWHYATYDWHRESCISEELLMGMRALFLPEAAVLGRGASLGIWSDKINELAVCAYDMQQVIRHDWSWFNNPEGDSMSRWFDKPYLHGSLPAPSTKCYTRDDGTPAMRLFIEVTPLRLLLDAVLTHKFILDLHIKAMMKLYTRDGRVLAIAQIVEDVLREANGRVLEGRDKHMENLEKLVGKIVALSKAYPGEEYQSLALERADRGELLTYGERRGVHLA